MTLAHNQKEPVVKFNTGWVSINDTPHHIKHVIAFVREAANMMQKKPAVLYAACLQVRNKETFKKAENAELRVHEWSQDDFSGAIAAQLLPFFFTMYPPLFGNKTPVQVALRREAFSEIDCLETHRAMIKLTFEGVL